MPSRLAAGTMSSSGSRQSSDHSNSTAAMGCTAAASFVWLARQLRSVPWALSMGLIVGGALGNLLDRLFRAPGPLHGHVVDFISVFARNGEAFPIFNAADSSLFCGVVLAIVLELTGRRRDGSRVRPEAGRGANAGGPTGEVRDSQREDA